MNHSTHVLEPLVKQWAVLLTTYRRDGTPVGTAVNIVVEGDLAYFRTWDTAWKLRRIRNNPEVEFAPSTALGRPTAPAIQARARVLEGGESARAGRLLARKYPAMHGLLVPLVHRLRGNKTMHVQLTPVGARSGEQTRCGAAEAGTTTGHEERASFCPHLLFYFPGCGQLVLKTASHALSGSRRLSQRNRRADGVTA